ncbi:MAG: PilC/PilY family type IV pilus protein [Gemmatimonadaceae bacterium]
MTQPNKLTKITFRTLLVAGLLAATGYANALTAPNDPPDLSTTPPDLSQSVDPNIVVTFDDSGSMTSNFMGDNRPFDNGTWSGPWFCAGVIDPRQSSGILSYSMNGVYYNPHVIYTPALYQDGTSFPNADKTLAKVLADGIAVNRPTGSVTPAAAAYNNNPQSAPSGSDTKVTIINGQYITNTNVANKSSSGKSATCDSNADAGSCSCSKPGYSSNVCTWTVTTTTNTDHRWTCGKGSYPTSFADGNDVKNGGPYYYRYAGPALTLDAYGNPDAAGMGNLYTSSNWEAVAIPNTDVTIAGKTVNQWQNFANWYAYYRTRNLMTRTALSRVFGVLGDNIRVAWQNINSNTLSASTIITNLNNTNASAPNYRNTFFNWIFATGASGSTPDRASTIRAGEFFTRSSKDLKDPYYDPGVGGDLGCRQNFHMLVTDGYWNEGDPSTPSGFFTSEVSRTLPDGTAYTVGDTQTEIYSDVQGTIYTSSLANIGYYYWAHDLRSDLALPKTSTSPFSAKVPTYIKDNTTGITTSTGATTAAQKEEIYFNPANDPADWRHVVQFMVTLGVAGNLHYSNDVDCTKSPNDLCALRQGVKNSSNAIGWPKPINNNPAAIDDTWHAAINSRGSFFSASNPANLVSHLVDIINSIVARSGQSSAESVSTSILNQGAVSYQGGYNSSGWSGYVYKQKLNPDTAAVLGGPPDWDAGCNLTGGLCAATGVNVPATSAPFRSADQRAIFTSIGPAASLTAATFRWASLDASQQAALSLDPTTTHPDTATALVPAANGTADDNGANRLLYLRGDRSYESAATPSSTNPVRFRSRASVLGAIIGSQTVYEGGPGGGHIDNYPPGSPEQTAGVVGDSYEKFVKDNITRPAMLYVGANDGMMHAFSADTGEEMWAYVPHSLYANGQLDQLTNPNNSLTVTIDDTPIIQDVFTSTPTDSTKAWRSMLVGSLRLGGRGVYALDVTKSDPVDEGQAKTKFLWEFSSEQDPDLGYTYGSANIARISCNVSPCSGTGTPGGTWVVLVSGGYFPKTLPGQANGNSAINTAAGVTGTTTYLWVLNASDGSVIKKIPTPNGITSYGLSTPDVVDFGLDQVDDLAVAGDLAGNLWRYDLSAPDPANWKVESIFKTYTSTSPCSATNVHGIGCEPISVMPVAFSDSVIGSVIYVFGTGQYLGNPDRIATNVLTPQHFFGVRDYGTGYSGYPFHEDDLNTQTVTQNSTGVRSIASAATASVNSPSRGWQIPLNISGITGERDVTTVLPLYSTGTAVLFTLIPGQNNDPCSPGRLGAVMAVNANNGGAPSQLSSAGSGYVGQLVKNPPALGSPTGISVLGGGALILPGLECVVGVNCPPKCTPGPGCPDPDNHDPLKLDGLTPIWRRTSWKDLLNDL